MPFGIQPIHLVIVAVVALLIFGPSRLPEIGRGVGRAITEFRRGAKEMGGSFMEEINQMETDQPQASASAPATAQMNAPENPLTTAPPAEEKPAVQVSYCIHCGKANPAGAVFCNQCGSKIAE